MILLMSSDRRLKQIDPRLKFGRNYKMRPYVDYCEEIIELGGGKGQWVRE